MTKYKTQVDEEIWKLTFPQITIPIEGGPGTGEVNVTELTLRAFKSPTFSFELAPPNGISWQSKGGSTKQEAIWLAGYYYIVPVSSYNLSQRSFVRDSLLNDESLTF